MNRLGFNIFRVRCRSVTSVNVLRSELLHGKSELMLRTKDDIRYAYTAYVNEGCK